MDKAETRLNGLLVVDKPGLLAADAAQPDQPARRLPTSHDVVQTVRRWSGQRRIGHTGTLDPMASGVLVLCLGAATRLVEYYQGHAKQYVAEIVLGVATDTYDATGNAVETAAPPSLSPAQLDAALEQFRGDIMQTPPVYSALKQAGESLHRKARRGERVEIASRPVTFYQLDLLAFTPPDHICLRARCSAGTYMRSLAYDLGRALGSCAHLAFLRREAAGPFALDDAHPLAEIGNAAQAGRLAELLLPVGARLELPALTIDPATRQRLGHGQLVSLAPPQPAPVEATPGLLAQAHTPDGHFAGIIRCLGPAQPPDTGAIWKAEKWLAAPETG
jgi:tRNA pseudouridine55 synthase